MELVRLPRYAVRITDELPAWGDLGLSHQISKVVVLVDDHTSEHCLPLLPADWPVDEVITIRPGEEYKNLETCRGLWSSLLDMQADRHALLINLGGGVIGDMGGFVASTYKRGIRFMQMPTTLLSQVDASVGGKLGIDHHGLKNVIGTFQDPVHIVACTRFLETLPFEQLRSGFAEVLKHGLIADRQYWESLKNTDLHNTYDWQDIIARSVCIKREVVEEDPYERGKRKVLNFGHTIGHAIETWMLTEADEPLLHGEAIAIGMICEAWLSVKDAGMSEKALTDITQVIRKYFPATQFDPSIYDALYNLMKQDKKNDSEGIRFSLLREPGDCGFDYMVSEEDVKGALEYYNNP
jgi:3-dehydroquinate synthase